MASSKEQFLDYFDKKGLGLKGRALCARLNIENHPQAIVMTRSQFDHLTKKMIPRVGVSPASYYMFFYPLSGHMTEDALQFSGVYPLVVLPSPYCYYKWHYGPAFPEQWVDFAAKINHKKCEYVMYDHETQEFMAVDEESGLVYRGRGFVAGGRLYSEEHARRLKVYDKRNLVL